MKLEDFKIGDNFYCERRIWHCTDIGTRIITAILGENHVGPPYAECELVFDEYDQEGCDNDG